MTSKNTNPSEEVAILHSYDGIQEYDNPMPGWWKLVFLLTCIFSVIYMAYYHNPSTERSVYADYSEAVADNMRLQFAEIGELEPNQATVMKYIDDDRWLTVGKTVFATHCKSCHGANGQGQTGYNLTDDKWKHVKHAGDIAKVVNEGANNKAMPAWGARLHPNEVVLVASYVASLRGSDPAGAIPAKADEKVIPSWEESWKAAKPESDAQEPAEAEETTEKE